ncbi:monovalent cation:proton antiporter-2 (CPA2) family protein [Rubellicoccus peritrichatus]|uniref:Monovalent cation:proton antiporter-2 (CPA2) family protein n=1 Tax=Rubellicoccus peritrichatus TaxID=3080537 RepID=A0AAQ3LBE5_9BACT|nr:monovalent cation:proton antiporter-2 (CPA2) family protein [Puniceicoccus sp. CR14]WOO40795.1 monovalent cation:proton antiporter-2 (CPA2) family protein [Puniceicoccus sp. CR14]
MLDLTSVLPLAIANADPDDGFLLHATVYLAAAVLAVPFAKRLGLGSVLGYIIAGVVIGPYVLGLVGAEGQSVMHAAEFGVVMMLFVVGLELRPAMLWRLRGPILGLGGAQVICTVLIIAGITMALGMSWQGGLAIGMCLSLSSTAIVLQSLNEKGLTRSRGGQASFSVLLFQDIAVIPMLAIMPFLAMVPEDDAAKALHTPHWQKAVLIIGVVAGIVLAGRYLTRPIFRYIAATQIREMFTAIALLLVIGVALLTQSVGLSPALGTFLAGVVLAESEFRHELEGNIEPFKGLLLGVFFIAVGATIDFPFLLKHPLGIAGIVIGLVVIKFVILFILGKVFHIGRDQNWLFSFALAQGGEFAFVLFSFAGTVDVLPIEVTTPLTLAVALSMMMTPLLLIIHERIVAPLMQNADAERHADDIDEENPIIIAGFGSFGNIIGRFLQANNIGTTVLDTDPEHIETLRKIGLKVYYGDASRIDLLHAAGADKARMLIVAVDEKEKANQIVSVAKKHFPNLIVYARALDYEHGANLFEYRADKWRHQNVGSALELGVDVLSYLGWSPFRAWRASRRFSRHEDETFKKLLKFREDDKAFFDKARQSREEIEKIFMADAEFKENPDHAWDNTSLKEEVSSQQEEQA